MHQEVNGGGEEASPGEGAEGEEVPEGDDAGEVADDAEPAGDDAPTDDAGEGDEPAAEPEADASEPEDADDDEESDDKPFGKAMRIIRDETGRIVTKSGYQPSRGLQFLASQLSAPVRRDPAVEKAMRELDAEKVALEADRKEAAKTKKTLNQYTKPV